jgi:3'-phosphoadenosine 5'-phosphosulfate sulfotransferase (PAPS reductase)/FAD synthetase
VRKQVEGQIDLWDTPTSNADETQNVFTKAQLAEMWKRPVERQYNVAISKMLEAIFATKGEMMISYSGGKDSSLLLDMYCEIISTTPWKDKPICVVFADTTTETSAMMKFIKYFIKYEEEKWGVKINLTSVRPPNKLTWATFVKENGIPLISKQQSKCIRKVKTDMKSTRVDFDTVKRLYMGGREAVKELRDLGFSDTSILALTGYVSSRDEFGKAFTLSRKWLPMVSCPVDLTEQCCVKIKEASLHNMPEHKYRMSGEMASESKMREAVYLKTGCNIRLPNGEYVSKPLGAMTNDGVLFSLQYRNVPICSDYGEIVKTPDGHYKCTKAQRTGCALCGFGCQYDTERFVRLQETEPAKIKFAFKPQSEGGAGFKEAIEYMNEHCGTKVLIPEV